MNHLLPVNLQGAFGRVEWIEDGPCSLGKFDSLRDEYLYGMWIESWSNRSSGEVDAPTGAFALIVNEPQDIAEIADAFGAPVRGIVGNFVGRNDSNGFVWFESYETPRGARERFEELESAYSEWLDADEDSV